MPKVHVGVKVVAPEKRDAFASLDDSIKASWESATGRQEDPGTFTQYTLEVEDADRFKEWAENEVSNVRYVEEVETVRKFDVAVSANPEPDGSYMVVELPDPASLRYVGLGDLSRTLTGRGVLVMGSDTGCGSKVREIFGKRFVPGQNFTSGDAKDTEDRDGHGSASGYMATPPEASYMPLKVLGDDGSGSSEGIVKSFYWAGDYIERHGLKKVVMNCSWGSSVTTRYYGPYRDGLEYFTSRGGIVVFAAGNENTYGLASPSNFSRVNPKVLSVIAFDKLTDQRASFSNYHEDASLCGPGVAELGYDHTGTLGAHNGTSFAAPWVTYVIASLATDDLGADLQKVVDTLKVCGRDSTEPAAEEGHGVVDALTTSWKILPKPEQPYYPELKRVTSHSFYAHRRTLLDQEVVLVGPGKNMKTSEVKGRYVPRALDR